MFEWNAQSATDDPNVDVAPGPTAPEDDAGKLGHPVRLYNCT
jgi:hypothetical protein